MTHVIRMTARYVSTTRVPRAGNRVRRTLHEIPAQPDVLQALRENQRLLREITSGYRMPRHPGTTDRPAASARWAAADPPTICCPTDVATLLGDEMCTLIQEQLRILLLDCKNRLLGCEIIYQGTIHSISIRAAEVLRPAVLVNAPALIVVHNHPSGDPSVSPEDVKATKALVAAGELLDIDVLDHVVLGSPGRYVSLREAGLVSPSTPHRSRDTAA